jgi:hypothetical protein
MTELVVSPIFLGLLFILSEWTNMLYFESNVFRVKYKSSVLIYKGNYCTYDDKVTIMLVIQ